MSIPLIFTNDGPINVTQEMFEAAAKDLTKKPISDVCSVLEEGQEKETVHCFTGTRDEFFSKYAHAPKEVPPEEPKPETRKPETGKLEVRYYYQIVQGEVVLEVGEVAGMRNRWTFLDLAHKRA